MYGVETFVHPDYQSRGVGSKLMNARFDLLRRLNLRGLVAGSMIIGYNDAYTEADGNLPVEQYVQGVVAGERFDPNLSKQLRKGFKVKNLIPNYTEEPRTHDWAAAILWMNPEYRPRTIPFPSKQAQQRARVGVAGSSPLS